MRHMAVGWCYDAVMISTLQPRKTKLGASWPVLGLGCWPIGGHYVNEKGLPCGYGQVDDEQSIRAIEVALDLGVTLFDTAPIYGCGHSERILARALTGKREQAILATKFSAPIDEERGIHLDGRRPVSEVTNAMEESLARLNTDVIDLYQLHASNAAYEDAEQFFATCEKLKAQGKILASGWSTDDPQRVAFAAQYPSCVAIQHRRNVVEGNTETTDLAAEKSLLALCRTPLGKGILSGKYDENSKFADDDVRQPWVDLKHGRDAHILKALQAARDLLTTDGRTPVQGALAYLWSLGEHVIPLPGFKSEQQVRELAGARNFGPLTSETSEQIEKLTAEYRQALLAN